MPSPRSGRRRSPISGIFAPRLIEMLESPAYRALSLSARRILDRLEIEWACHGGTTNGQLVVTFAQFIEYGLYRDAIAPSIREVGALGFAEVTQQGRAGNADFRRPSEYRITYLPTAAAGPTHEWRQITEDDAKMIAQGARRAGSNSANSGVPKNRKPVQETGPTLVQETGPNLGPESGPCQSGNRTETPVQKTGPLSRSYPFTALGAEAAAEVGEVRAEPETPTAEPMAMAAMTELPLPFADQVERVRNPVRGTGVAATSAISRPASTEILDIPKFLTAGLCCADPGQGHGAAA